MEDKQKGITLIALVITIVLMLILASVTINVSINSGLFDNAKDAKLRTEITELQSRLMKKQMLNEGKNLNGKINEILGMESEYNDKLMIEDSELVYIEDKWNEKNIEILEELKIYKSKYDIYKENSETIYYIANENTLKNYEGLTNIGTLENFRDLVNAGTFNYEQAVMIEDIKLNEGKYSKNSSGKIQFAEDAVQWIPIGKSPKSFEKIFDGQGYTISGIYIDADDGMAGLFADVNGTIKNLIVDNSYIYTTSSNAGGIIARMNNGNVLNVVNKAYVESSNSNVGGIVGYIMRPTTDVLIENCANYGKIKSNSYCGGLCGRIIINETNVKVTIKNCYNMGNITSLDQNSNRAASIVGASGSGSIIKNVYNCGIITNNGKVKGNFGAGDLSDCYCLEGTQTNENSEQIKTKEIMKTQDFVDLLNTVTTEEETTTTQNAWTIDTKGINKGFPILLWQAK